MLILDKPRAPGGTPMTMRHARLGAIALMPPRERRSPRALCLRLWPRIRPYRGGLYIAGVTLLLASAITLAFPLVVRLSARRRVRAS